MASSNRHWPSMFKSKPCNTQHHQWQHNSDINPSLVSSIGCNKASYTSGCEERSPEPKPRWNPRPEQIRILEAIFNSGMVNPPRDEIRKIRAQLQEYGQVGDANVFYWFQNRKSRSKHKQRHLHQSKQAQQQQNPSSTSNNSTVSVITPPTSSSSSSDKSSPQTSAERSFSIGSSKNFIDLSQSPTASVNQHMPSFLSPTQQTHHTDFLSESFFFPGATATNNNFTSQGFGFQDILAANVDHQAGVVAPPPCPTSDGLFFSDLQVMNNQEAQNKVIENDDVEKMKLQEHQLFSSNYPLATFPASSVASTIPIPSTTHQVQGGGGDSGGMCGGGVASKSTTVVFINDVAVEVPVGPFNVRGAFGDDTMLLYSTGEPVLVNEWGVTVQPLQHGVFYYLFRPTTPSSMSHDTTIDLI